MQLPIAEKLGVTQSQLALAWCLKNQNVSSVITGASRPDSTLSSVHNLARVLRNQGKYEVAVEMNRRALKGSEKVLGAENPDTLTSVYCLAYLLQAKGQYDDASVLYQRAIAGLQKTLGPHHPTTLACSEHYSSLLDKLNGG
jgi:tetratricopeptide (TPR) repeat protein